MEQFINDNFDKTLVFEDEKFVELDKPRFLGKSTFIHFYDEKIITLSINSIVFAIQLRKRNGLMFAFISHYYENGELNIDCEFDNELEKSITSFINKRIGEDPLALLTELAKRLIPICHDFANASVDY